MGEKGSYQIETIASHIEIEISRLKAQVELFWDKELKHYIEYGLNDGMVIVELGSGPGYATKKILEQFPNVNVTAVEIDPIMVKYSKDFLSKFNRCKIIQKSIMETGLIENSFDFAITRLVLEHLPDPVNAAREVLRILKPGCRAVFIDNDFEMHIMTYPHIPELRDLYHAYCKARTVEEGNPTIGRELPSILQKCGFSKVDFEVISAHSAVVGDDMFFKSEGIGIPLQLVQKGYLPSKVLGAISIEWRKMIKSESHSIVRQLYMAIGEKQY